MQEQQRQDRDWEHWPGRGDPEHGLRGRLRALFTPTDQEDAGPESLIAAHGRELERRTEQLADTIADLERREEQTRRLRTAVEEMLRRGAAELDDRHADLNELAAELSRRDERVAELETDLAERRRELGAVELRSAALERREQSLAEREGGFERIAAELAERERRLAEAERKIAQLVAREAELDARQQQLERAAAELDDGRRALAAEQASLEQRERHVGELEARERELAGLAASLERREADLQRERTLIESGRGELTRAVAAVSTGLGLPVGAADAAAAATHVLFAPGDRYRLAEAEGPAPAVGAAVELEGAAYVVTRVGGSPLPGDPRRCAYLEPLPPRTTDDGA